MSGKQDTEKVALLFVYRRLRQERLNLYRAGEGPDEFLYGMRHLNFGRFETAFVEGDDHKWSMYRRLCYPLELLISRRLRIGFALHVGLENLGKLRQADVIVTTNDNCGLPIAMLKTLGLVKAPIVYISIGLSDLIEGLASGSVLRSCVKTLYRRFLRSTDRIVTFGEGATEHSIAMLELDRHKVVSVPFGIDTEFWTPCTASRQGDYLLSVGSDAARDYETLLKAVGEEDLKIVTKRTVPAELITPRTEVGSEFTDLELRELYRSARFVVTPVKDVTQPSGQSATLQAMACEKAVIISRSRGLWEPAHMRHDENCYLVTPEDPDDLRRAIAHLTRHPDEAARIGRNARITVETRYTSRHFSADLAREIDRVLAALRTIDLEVIP